MHGALYLHVLTVGSSSSNNSTDGCFAAGIFLLMSIPM
jgi:hypothetical protein